jgi:hypothetical protein
MRTVIPAWVYFIYSIYFFLFVLFPSVTMLFALFSDEPTPPIFWLVCIPIVGAFAALGVWSVLQLNLYQINENALSVLNRNGSLKHTIQWSDVAKYYVNSATYMLTLYLKNGSKERMQGGVVGNSAIEAVWKNLLLHRVPRKPIELLPWQNKLGALGFYVLFGALGGFAYWSAQSNVILPKEVVSIKGTVQSIEIDSVGDDKFLQVCLKQYPKRCFNLGKLYYVLDVPFFAKNAAVGDSLWIMLRHSDWADPAASNCELIALSDEEWEYLSLENAQQFYAEDGRLSKLFAYWSLPIATIINLLFYFMERYRSKTEEQNIRKKEAGLKMALGIS